MISTTPPKRRNGQIRTYWRLLQFGLTNRLVNNPSIAKELYQQFQTLKSRIETNAKDRLTDVDLAELITAAQKVLGFPSNPIEGRPS